MFGQSLKSVPKSGTPQPDEKNVAKLCESANLFIPKHGTNFYKFCWS